MPAKLTSAQKALSGTLRKHRETPPRTPEEVAEEIEDVREAMHAMYQNLHLATEAITEKGMFVTTMVLDSHGVAVEAERINPAIKVQRDALNAVKSLRKHLALLQEEEAAANVKQSEAKADPFAEF